jgi:multidrug resistance efflux pump
VSSRRQSAARPTDHAIFGDEAAAELRAEVESLRTLVADLTRQVHAQFTTISAHAEIARQQAEFAREEARADLERTRSLVIELVERTRHELMAQAQASLAGASAGVAHGATSDRIAELQARVDGLISGIDRCFDRQRVLANTVEALFDAVMVEQRNEPVTGLSLV